MGTEDKRRRSQQPKQPKQPKWVENVAFFGIAMLIFIVASLAVGYVHINAPMWEAPAIFVSLGLGLLPVLWYWRFRRYGWFVTIISGLLLAFSFGAVLFHGWEVVAIALVNVAAILLVVFMFANLAHFTRRYESGMRAAGEALNGDPLFRRDVLFRDDGQRITVYPRRRRLILSCVVQAAILAGIVCVFAFVRTSDPRIWISLGLLVCVLIPVFLATLYRLAIRKPSLVVGPDGILDSGTILWSGVGLLRWDEILAVYPTMRSSGWVKQHFLDIMVADLPTIRRRLPLLKRVALRSTFSGMSQLLVAQMMLETPVDDLAQQVDQYVESHAPPGWRDRAVEDDASTPHEE